MKQRKNQWFDDVAELFADYNLSDDEINRIAADYELMAEPGRLANKMSGVTLLSIGSTYIREENQKERYTHGSTAGNLKQLAKDVVVAMYNDLDIAKVITEANKMYRSIMRESKR